MKLKKSFGKFLWTLWTGQHCWKGVPLRILETMTPLDFLDFRDLLIPASGFQSFQFRLIENKLGLQDKRRVKYGGAQYTSRLSGAHQKLIEEAQNKPSLFTALESWLERTPFLTFAGFDFWKSYRKAVTKMLDHDLKTIQTNPLLSQEAKTFQVKELAQTRAGFAALFNEKEHEKMIKKGQRRLSSRATQAALLIQLYRDEPILHLPYRLVTVRIDIDEWFTTWRYRHALMVDRMIGTGGSSGQEYLKKNIEANKIFLDLFNLSTYLIPRSVLPELPEVLRKNLDFYYTQPQNRQADAGR